jgi:hypothetical protein
LPQAIAFGALPQTPPKTFLEKKFLDFKKLLSVETCGFDKVSRWMSVQKTEFFAVQSS